MHETIAPAILYFGTPVLLVSTTNPDGSTNVAPMSSAWWLGWSCVLGFGARSQTPQNLLRMGECVLNLPSIEQAAHVDALAKTTGTSPVPPHKQAMGYVHVADKLGHARLTPMPSTKVAPPRLAECPVQLEARLRGTLPLRQHDPATAGHLLALEVEIVAVHVEQSLLRAGKRHQIDPRRWRPLIMSFQELFGLTPPVVESTLATIPEEHYRPQALR